MRKEISSQKSAFWRIFVFHNLLPVDRQAKPKNGAFGEAGDVKTAASKKVGVVVNKITTVSLENNYNDIAVAQSISSGVAANAAIIKVTTDTSDNTLSNGDVAKALLNKIKVQIESSATISAVTIEKINGSQAAVTGSVSGAYAQFSISGTDYELAPATTAYYLVKVTSTFTGTYAGQFSIKTNLDNLNGTDATNTAADGGNLIWKDSSAATAKNDLRLSTSNYSGTLIKN